MFSKDLEHSIGQCYKRARDARHEFMTVEHLLLALLDNNSAEAVLKAVGARTSTLFAGLVVQAVAVTAIAVVIAAGLALLLDAVIPPGSIPLDVTARRIVSSAVLLLIAAVAGCAFSLRRVLRVEPASAIGTLA